jgi:hypothetical protein
MKKRFKRIAVLAIAALGMGVLSVTPASAAQAVTATVTAGGGTSTAGTGTCAIANTCNFTVTQTITGGTAADTVTVTTTADAPATSAYTDAQWNDAVRLSQTGTDNGSYSWGTVNATSGAIIATAAGATGTPTIALSFTPDVTGTWAFTIATTESSTGTVTNPSITYTVTVTNASTVGSIYVSKYSIASGYAAFPGTSAAVSSGGTAVTLVGGTYASTSALGLYSLGSSSSDATLDYIGTFAATPTATAGTLTAGARAALAAANTGLAANLAIGTPASTYTAYKVINANGINAMTVSAGASAALLVKLSNAQGTSTTAKVRAIINGAGQIGISSALAVASGAQTTAMVPFTAPSVAGTYPMTIQYSTDASFDNATSKQLDIAFTLTVSALSGYSNSLSTAYAADGDLAAVGTASTDGYPPVAGPATAAVATPNLPVGMVSIALKNAAGGSTGNALTNTLTASVSGPGYIVWAATGTDSWSATGCSGTKARSADLTATSAANSFFICGDGTTGKATITIRVTDVAGTVQTLATKTATFYGPVTKLEATTIYSIGKAGGGTVGNNAAARTASTIIPAVIIKATDANGNGVGGLTIGLVSSDTTQANSSATAACNADTPDDAVFTNAYSSGGIGFYNCQIVTPVSATSGKSGTLTWRVLDPAGDGTTYLTAVTNFSIGGALTTSTATLDKTTYEPGEAMKITITGKDASGNAPYDGQSALYATLTSNKAVGGSLPGTSRLTTNGVATSSSTSPAFAPVSSGAFTISGYDANLNAIKLTATVVDAAGDAKLDAAADAAAEAIDAANAATDAANLAAEAADAATVAAEEARDAADAATAAVEELATQVATLMAALKAQITTLANTVAKIAKKVKA